MKLQSADAIAQATSSQIPDLHDTLELVDECFKNFVASHHYLINRYGTDTP